MEIRTNNPYLTAQSLELSNWAATYQGNSEAVAEIVVEDFVCTANATCNDQPYPPYEIKGREPFSAIPKSVADCVRYIFGFQLDFNQPDTTTAPTSNVMNYQQQLLEKQGENWVIVDSRGKQTWGCNGTLLTSLHVDEADRQKTLFAGTLPASEGKWAAQRQAAELIIDNLPADARKSQWNVIQYFANVLGGKTDKVPPLVSEGITSVTYETVDGHKVKKVETTGVGEFMTQVAKTSDSVKGVVGYSLNFHKLPTDESGQTVTRVKYSQTYLVEEEGKTYTVTSSGSQKWTFNGEVFTSVRVIEKETAKQEVVTPAKRWCVIQ